MKFIVGDLAGISFTSIVHPMDFVNTLMQMSATANAVKLEYGSTWDCIMKVAVKCKKCTKSLTHPHYIGK